MLIEAVGMVYPDAHRSCGNRVPGCSSGCSLNLWELHTSKLWESCTRMLIEAVGIVHLDALLLAPASGAARVTDTAAVGSSQGRRERAAFSAALTSSGACAGRPSAAPSCAATATLPVAVASCGVVLVAWHRYNHTLPLFSWQRGHSEQPQAG
eukprot:gene14880-biopygen23142